MSISAPDSPRKTLFKIARNDLLAAAACAVFGAVYEAFSFGVYSYFMLCAFAVPLLLGALPFLLLGLRRAPALPPAAARKLWHAGTATLTVGCLFRGVLEIYGTSSGLGAVYWAVGGALLAAGAAANLPVKKKA